MSLSELLERLGGSWVDENEEQELLDASFEDDYNDYVNNYADD
jgi:hypothetical protein